ncbi:MAG: BlaI/MecI/CopY family transcriptional regulator [Planctomycetota bacterium]|nr:BlaI/MecI/CopY family transcriptional regulator [Planctomycetota bacterium]
MQISDAEWTVMNLIWGSQPTEASDVIERLAEDHTWSPATIKTMLHRLVRKGALTAISSGKKYIYSCRVKRADCVKRASRSFLERVFGGDAAPALLHLVASSKLTPAEIDDLRKLLDSMDR